MVETKLETKERRIVLDREFTSIKVEFDDAEVTAMLLDRARQVLAENHPTFTTRTPAEINSGAIIRYGEDFEGFGVEFVYDTDR